MASDARGSFKACCDAFASRLAEAGRKGFTVIAFKDGDRRRFMLQGRAIEFQDIVGMEAEAARQKSLGRFTASDELGNPVSWSPVIQMLISFCPFCGTELQRVIDSQIGAFDETSKRQRVFALGTN